MQRLELKHFRLVQAIAEQGTLSAAATYLHLTQSALSHQLKQLEQECAQALFMREGRGLVLTFAGERFLQEANELLPHIERLSRDLKSIAKGERGRIRVATECYTTFMWLPKILPELKLRYPLVDVEVVPVISEHPLDELSEGKVDVAIRMSGAKAPYQSYPLFKDELKVYIHPEHRFSKLKQISAEDFSSETLVVCPVAKKRLMQGLFYKSEFAPERIVDMPLTEAVLAWSAANFGVCVMAEWAVADMMERYDLISRPLTMPWMKRTWHAVTLNQTLPESTRYFIELLRSLKLD